MKSLLEQMVDLKYRNFLKEEFADNFLRGVAIGFPMVLTMKMIEKLNEKRKQKKLEKQLADNDVDRTV